MAETPEHPTDVRPELQLGALERERDHALARGDKETAKAVEASIAALAGGGKTRRGARRATVDQDAAETTDAAEE